MLNKADLCPPPLVIAWKHYLTSQFPHLHIVCFTSHPGQPYSTGEERESKRKEKLEAEIHKIWHQTDMEIELPLSELFSALYLLYNQTCHKSTGGVPRYWLQGLPRNHSVPSSIPAGNLCCMWNPYLVLVIVLQKKRMRRKGDWSKAGGPVDILKACQEITAGRGGRSFSCTLIKPL